MPKGVPTRVAAEIAEAACTDATLKLCNDIAQNGLKVAIVGCLAGGPPGALLAISPVLALVSLKAWTVWREKQDDAEIRAELAEARVLLERVKLDQADAKEILLDLIEHRSWVAARLPGYEKDDLAERVAKRVSITMQREVLDAVAQKQLLDAGTVAALRDELAAIADTVVETYDTVKGLDQKFDAYVAGRTASAAPADRRFSLPGIPANFTGREKELADLRSRITGGATISALRGMGGIGKTALAIVLANEVKGAYPDGRIIVEMRGTATHGEAPLMPAEAMAQVIHAFRPEAKLPDNSAEVAAIYRTLLHEKKVLLLLDNAADRAQVEPMLPPPGCLLLVTSRTHFALGGLASIDLGVMDAGDAATLLRALCPRIGDDAPALAKGCGHLPKALHLAGDALATRADLTVARYLERLEAERLAQLDRYEDDQEATMTASIALSEALLRERDAALADRWLVLGVFPGDFDALAAAAVWGVPMEGDDAADALGDLRVRSMVEWDKDTKRYRLHDLVRDYAVERCHLDAAEDAGRRHAEHYLRVLAAANGLYLKYGKHTIRGLALYDAEAENIDAGFAWALAQSNHDVVASALVDQYPRLPDVLELRQHVSNREAWARAGLAAAERTGDLEGIAMHAGNLGVIRRIRGDLEEAEVLHRKSLACCITLDNKMGMAMQYGNLGLLLKTRGDLHGAEAMYRHSLAIDEQLGRKLGLANQYGNLGVVLQSRGDLDGAEHAYRKSLAINEQLGRKSGIANQHGNLGAVLILRGDVDSAADLFHDALTLFEELDHKAGKAASLGNIGAILLARGDLCGAKAKFHQALDIYEQLENLENIANCCANLGVITKQGGDDAEARRLWTRARNLFDQMGATPMAKRVQGWLDGLPPG